MDKNFIYRVCVYKRKIWQKILSNFNLLTFLGPKLRLAESFENLKIARLKARILQIGGLSMQNWFL
jgi:hypothetical protein